MYEISELRSTRGMKLPDSKFKSHRRTQPLIQSRSNSLHSMVLDIALPRHYPSLQNSYRHSQTQAEDMTRLTDPVLAHPFLYTSSSSSPLTLPFTLILLSFPSLCFTIQPCLFSHMLSLASLFPLCIHHLNHSLSCRQQCDWDPQEISMMV